MSLPTKWQEAVEQNGIYIYKLAQQTALSRGWLAHIVFSSFVTIDVNLKPGLAFDSDPSHTFYSDSNTTFVLKPSPVLNFSLAFNCDPVPVLDSIPRSASNSHSATNHNPDLNETQGKQFLHLLYFDPD
ncbi:hypothetical protein EVAR_22505_1 [Eumeta japonica]|nr:hypothetical protein EVAR_22505_1 [Eumeta japonica]